MKKIFVSALVCAVAIACSVGVQAACPAHGSKSITTTCAGYPNSCEVRKCSIGSHPSDCQTQRYSNMVWSPVVLRCLMAPRVSTVITRVCICATLFTMQSAEAIIILRIVHIEALADDDCAIVDKQKCTQHFEPFHF